MMEIVEGGCDVNADFMDAEKPRGQSEWAANGGKTSRCFIFPHILIKSSYRMGFE